MHLSPTSKLGYLSFKGHFSGAKGVASQEGFNCNHIKVKVLIDI